MTAKISVYLERGTKRIFACAHDWPGWCRHGRSDDEALEALFAYGPKYRSVLARTKLGFKAPRKIEQLSVTERLRGDATTDFGAIGMPPRVDRDRTCTSAEVERFEKILRAGWRAFDKAVESARGKKLATGPRGGGRSLDAIVKHVIGADEGYIRAVGWNPPKNVKPSERLPALRGEILAAVRASATGDLPARGPRGGVRWTARYYVRRVAWHVIAHAWEIERRAWS